MRHTQHCLRRLRFRRLYQYPAPASNICNKNKNKDLNDIKNYTLQLNVGGERNSPQIRTGEQDPATLVSDTNE
jgi:hypothetical protein